MTIDSVEAFNVGVLVRFSRLYVVEFDAVVLAPVGDDLRYILRSVIDPYRIRIAAPLDQAIQCPYNPIDVSMTKSNASRTPSSSMFRVRKR